jgi:hypothetical protein
VIAEHAGGVAAALEAALGVDPRVADGLPGEFTVFVGAREVYRKDGDYLPTAGEVVAAVGGMTPARPAHPEATTP